MKCIQFWKNHSERSFQTLRHKLYKEQLILYNMNVWLLVLTIILIIGVIALVLANLLLTLSKRKQKGEKNDKN